jgi:hypothetical protein
LMRERKVKDAWADAYRRIASVYDPSGVTIDKVREYAPALAGQIEEAEKAAEAASLAWLKGGPGGVQAKIDRWVSLWLEGVEAVRSAA